MSAEYHKYKQYDLDTFTITKTDILVQNQYFTVKKLSNDFISVNGKTMYIPDLHQMVTMDKTLVALCENYIITLCDHYITVYALIDGQLKIKSSYPGIVGDDKFINVIHMYSYFIIINDNFTNGNILFDINDPTHTFNNVKPVPVDATIHELAAIDRSGTITWFGHLLYAETLLHTDGKTYNFIVKGWPKDAVGKYPLFHLKDIKWISNGYYVFYVNFRTLVIVIDLRNQCRLKISFNSIPILGADDEYIILPYGKIGIIAISSYGVKEVDTTQKYTYTYTHGEFTGTPTKRYTIIMPKSAGTMTKPALHE